MFPVEPASHRLLKKVTHILYAPRLANYHGAWPVPCQMGDPCADRRAANVGWLHTLPMAVAILLVAVDLLGAPRPFRDVDDGNLTCPNRDNLDHCCRPPFPSVILPVIKTQPIPPLSRKASHSQSNNSSCCFFSLLLSFSCQGALFSSANFLPLHA